VGFRVAAINLEWTPADLEAAALQPLDAVLEEHRCSSREEIVKAARDADAVLSALVPFPADVLAELRRCRVISETAVGTDHIDVAAAATAGMYVTNVPDYGTAEVADHTLALALMLLRRVVEQRELVRRGVWNPLARRPIARLAEATWGIVGFGRIGQAVAVRTKAFGFRRVAHDPFVADWVLERAGVEPAELERLLREADVVSLHAPLTARTTGMISARELAWMKPTAVLVNVARGALVDEKALLEALDDGALSGAGLDVLSEEPPASQHPLIHHPRTIVTPHMAFYSETALHELRRKAIDAVVDVLEGRRPRYVVAEPSDAQAGAGAH
jgi:D-3-phosphoglycerate dehydrogenase / 2-oxoglutarate reductase